jgi:hypothetical protein
MDSYVLLQGSLTHFTKKSPMYRFSEGREEWRKAWEPYLFPSDKKLADRVVEILTDLADPTPQFVGEGEEDEEVEEDGIQDEYYPELLKHGLLLWTARLNKQMPKWRGHPINHLWDALIFYNVNDPLIRELMVERLRKYLEKKGVASRQYDEILRLLELVKALPSQDDLELQLATSLKEELVHWLQEQEINLRYKLNGLKGNRIFKAADENHAEEKVLFNTNMSLVLMFFFLLIDLDVISVSNSYSVCKWIFRNIAVVESPEMSPGNIHKLYQELSLSTNNAERLIDILKSAMTYVKAHWRPRK